MRAFVTRLLADADAAGFTIDDVIAVLTERASERGTSELGRTARGSRGPRPSTGLGAP